MEFYKASLWVIGQKSNTISQKTKSTKEPYLHEQILTMEIKHELQLPAGEKSEKYEHTVLHSCVYCYTLCVDCRSSVLVDKTKAYYNQSKTGDLFLLRIAFV